MILESVEHGPPIWPTFEENGVIRTKKYAELSAAEKIQADYDMKVTNIILQGLPTDIYSLVNHHRVAKDLWERIQLRMQGLVPNTASQQPCIPPNKDDWDHLFQPMFDEYFNPSTIAVSPVLVAATPRAINLVDSPMSTSID
nr:hypothetical protein [Tanacetum cinerariifolium]